MFYLRRRSYKLQHEYERRRVVSSNLFFVHAPNIGIHDQLSDWLFWLDFETFLIIFVNRTHIKMEHKDDFQTARCYQGRCSSTARRNPTFVEIMSASANLFVTMFLYSFYVYYYNSETCPEYFCAILHTECHLNTSILIC